MRELAQLLLPAVRWDPTLGFASAAPALTRAIAAGVGGFVVEGGSRDAVAELTANLRRRSADAPIIVVALATLASPTWRRRPLSLPPPAAIASLRDALVVRRVARAAAREARLAGCNAILAPSCDVAASARVDAFGSEGSQVALAAVEWIDAAQAEGVLCFAGSFPGGGTETDVVTGVPTVRQSDDALYASDLVPFRAAIDAGVAGLLVADATYPSLDASGIPAAMSKPVVSRLLRAQLGFEGLAVADAAVLATRWGKRIAAPDLVAAGIDVVLRPVNLDVELRALIDALESRALDRERVHEAAHRRRMRAELAAGASGAGPNESNDDAGWLDEVAERTIAVVRGRRVRVGDPVEVAIVGAAPDHAASVLGAFAAGITDAGSDGSGVRRVAAPSAVVRTTLVVFVTPQAGRVASTATSMTEQQAAALCAEARRLGRDSVLVWCGHPTGGLMAPSASLTIACWSATTAMVRAAGRWLLRRV